MVVIGRLHRATRKGVREVTTAGRIVVGVDGSAPAEAALEWAAQEARLRGWTLEVLHAEFARRAFLDLYPEIERAEERILDSAVRRARQLAPDIDVVATLVDPPAASALIAAGRGADLLVVGSRGMGEVRGMLLGSVSSECAHRADCPVLIVRAPQPDPLAGTAARQSSAEG